MNRLVRSVLVVAAIVGLLIQPSAEAWAHSSILSTKPAADAVLDAAPTKVVITFDSPLMDMGSAMVVRREDGTVVSTGDAQVANNKIAVAVDPAAGAGTYTVAFRIVSQDGHSVTSNYTFSVKGVGSAQAGAAANSPAPTVAPSDPASDTVVMASPAPVVAAQPAQPSGVFGPPLLGVAVLVAAGLAIGAWLMTRRRRNAADQDE